MANPDSLLLDEESFKKIAQTLKIGVALVELEDWKVLFENASFFKWFAPNSDADEPLTERMPALNPERVRARVQDG